jgi:hypothetical protein
MLRIVMRILEMVRGGKSSAPAELSKSKPSTSPLVRLLGMLCVLIGVVYFADRYLGQGQIMALLSKKKPTAAPVVSMAPPSIPDIAPDEPGLEPSTGPAVWKRYDTPDHLCSAEFPGPPKQAERKTASAESHQLLLQREPNLGFYGLSQVSAPSEKSQTLEEAVENLRNAFGAVNDHAIKQGNLNGWQLDFNMDDKLSMNRIFVRESTVYRANVVIDKLGKDTPEVKRFLDSIRFDLGPSVKDFGGIRE